jgi:hypothetical protein
MKILFLIISLFFISGFVNAKKNNYVAASPEDIKLYSKEIKKHVKLLESIRPKIKFSNYDIDIDYCSNLAINPYNVASLKMCRDLLKELSSKTIIQS